LRVATEESPDLVLLGPACGVPGAPELLEETRAVLLRRLPCSALVLPGTLPPRADEDGAGAPAASEDPGTSAREEPEGLELAAAGD
ncbi:MAG TPA: hypothetical protein VFV24_02515, partial [Candidatus Eisenbacteria bacterium]|nr:hypothetical protein [Candidatus Eisenbacteria bacterium]